MFNKYLGAAVLALAISLSGLGAHASDANAPIEKINVPSLGTTLDYQRLFEAISEEGETKDAFANRISPRLRQFSDETRFEACGVIATDGKRFGVVVGTSRSHIACANFHEIVPDGMRFAGETIHSHGSDSRFTPNTNDRVLMGNFLETTSANKNSGRPLKSLSGQDLDEFSDGDFDSGPGYLATPNGAIYQAGKRNVRAVATL